MTFFARLIGETFNILFYKKKKYIWYSNSKFYWGMLLLFLAIASLPYFHIFISLKMIEISTILITISGIICFYYLYQIKDYKLMYKNLSSITNIMDSKNDKDYFKQAMVAMKEKDKSIDKRKIEGKKGYDFFNIIFFERHKEIVSRSAKKYTFILGGIYILLCYLSISNQGYKKLISDFLEYHLGWFVVIMYFINRGAIITQAMFFNCDHAMLNYSFYRQRDSLLTLFKKRLQTIAKVNLLPASIIGIGNSILLLITNHKNPIIIISSFLYILCLSIFFSVHYLVIYYLLQPFNKEMEVKKASYSFATLGTYIISYQMTNVVMNSIDLSILGLIVTIIYIYIALKLIYHFAPKTFKLN